MNVAHHLLLLFTLDNGKLVCESRAQWIALRTAHLQVDQAMDPLLILDIIRRAPVQQGHCADASDGISRQARAIAALKSSWTCFASNARSRGGHDVGEPSHSSCLRAV